MSPESYQQTRPRSCFRTCRLHLDRCHDPASIRCLRSAPSKPPVARSGEDSALILPEVSSANRHRQMEVRHVSALNEFNAERRSKGAKAAPHQLMPTVPASTPDARRSWDGSMTLPDDATPQTSLFNRGHAQELLRDKMPTKIAGCRPTRARSTGPRSSANFPLKYRISNPPHDEWPHNASESP